MKILRSIFLAAWLLASPCLGQESVGYQKVSVQGTAIHLVTVALNSKDVEIRPVLAPAGNTIPLEGLLHQGGAPVAAALASTACRAMRTPPLSSLAPRPYTLPSRSCGSNGGVSHSSSGSGGCTS